MGWTLAFLGVALLITHRTERSFALQQRIQMLNDSVAALDGARIRLLNHLTEFRTPSELGARVLGQGLRFPSDSEIVSLPLTGSR